MASASAVTPATSASASKKPAEVGPRGIPKATFIDNVEEYFAGDDSTKAEKVLNELQEMLAKYRFMEQSTLQKRSGMEEKVPELERTLEMIAVLQAKKDAEETMETHFELADTLYARAEVPPVDEVYLWLGANTMLAYPLAEAHSLLSSKLTAARTRLSEAKEDAVFLRDQITTTEVSTARVYNHTVKRRREEREKAQAEAEQEDGRG